MFGTQMHLLAVVLNFIRLKDRAQLDPRAVLIQTRDESLFRAPFRAPFLALCLTPFSAPFLRSALLDVFPCATACFSALIPPTPKSQSAAKKYSRSAAVLDPDLTIESTKSARCVSLKIQVHRTSARLWFLIYQGTHFRICCVFLTGVFLFASYPCPHLKQELYAKLHLTTSRGARLERLNCRLALQGYLAHKKQHPPPGPPKGPRHRPTLGSYGGCVFNERGTPVGLLQALCETMWGLAR